MKFTELWHLENKWVPRWHPYRWGWLAHRAAKRSGGDFYEIRFGALEVRAFSVYSTFYLHEITSHWLRCYETESAERARELVAEEKRRINDFLEVVTRTAG